MSNLPLQKSSENSQNKKKKGFFGSLHNEHKNPKNPHKLNLMHFALDAFVLITITGFVGIYMLLNSVIQNQNKIIQSTTTNKQNVTEITDLYSQLSAQLPEKLFEDHIAAMNSIAVRSKLTVLQQEFDDITNTEEGSQNKNIADAYTLYEEFQEKLARNERLSLNQDYNSEDVLTDLGRYILNKEFENFSDVVAAELETLEDNYNQYLASLPPPASAPSGGYSFVNVNTERGTFGTYVLKFPKIGTTVKTVSANGADCSRDCPTKSLAQFVSENGATAGLAGSYTCPADYAQCADKKWSFDFALYDSNKNSWINKNARSWNETGMITFNGSSSRFYEESSDYDGDNVTAAISNFPSLLKENRIVVDEGDTDSYQEIKGVRGAIGVDDNNIYLVYVTGASVVDTAYVMRSLGATDALNLDGGGTTAMHFNGGYILGPGRPLANAVVIIR